MAPLIKQPNNMWNYMNDIISYQLLTAHKILMHESQIISHAVLPIEQLPEGAAEVHNKNFRQNQSNFSKKWTSTECNLDTFNRLLLTLDPS